MIKFWGTSIAELWTSFHPQLPEGQLCAGYQSYWSAEALSNSFQQWSQITGRNLRPSAPLPKTKDSPICCFMITFDKSMRSQMSSTGLWTLCNGLVRVSWFRHTSRRSYSHVCRSLSHQHSQLVPRHRTKASPWSQSCPTQPDVHKQTPVKRLHSAPFWHWHVNAQFAPYLLAGQTEEKQQKAKKQHPQTLPLQQPQKTRGVVQCLPINPGKLQ